MKILCLQISHEIVSEEIEASFNFVEEEEDERDSSGVIFDALDESYQEDQPRRKKMECQCESLRRQQLPAQAKREQRN